MAGNVTRSWGKDRGTCEAVRLHRANILNHRQKSPATGSPVLKQFIQTVTRLYCAAVARRAAGEGVGSWGAADIMWEGNSMIRAIVGTVAVLAGFAVLERSVDASTGHA